MNSRQPISSSSSSSGGIGVLGLIQAVFIILHFVPQAEWNPILYWSWWQILIPTFIGVGIFVLFLVILIIGAVIAAVVGSRK
ncbi:membrane protein [Mycobacterium phage Phabba]|uniref:Membrane protein n=1 Tax=Mycobacterium phage Phabba TaxID=2027899 RepID=A0A249XST7_9CAUD|nr:membrane protein [Mycobacterium phage Phabba]ASZ74812.1 membrane protein [Mycobacterium phage Phabba]